MRHVYLPLNVSGVTLRGAGMDKTILSFKNQIQVTEGVQLMSDWIASLDGDC